MKLAFNIHVILIKEICHYTDTGVIKYTDASNKHYLWHVINLYVNYTVNYRTESCVLVQMKLACQSAVAQSS
jgi:hypothetical protein